jgi:hypothetical protein
MKEYDTANVLGLFFSCIKNRSYVILGHAVAQLVETLRYKPEGRGFDY